VRPGTAGLDDKVFAAGAEVVVFLALQGPDGGMTGGVTADIANCILECTEDVVDVADGENDCSIASCVLGHAGEVMGDEQTGRVPG
jgi:hypothetical protein